MLYPSRAAKLIQNCMANEAVALRDAVPPRPKDAAVTTLAHIKSPMPAARVEKEMTMRSLATGVLTERSMIINSVKSSAAHTSANVNGLAAVIASNPNPHKVNEPAHANALVKVSFTEAVSKIEIASVTKLNA